MLSPFWSVIIYKGLPSCLNIITFFSEEWKIIDAISICNDVRQVWSVWHHTFKQRSAACTAELRL